MSVQGRNWFADHAITSIIAHTILVAGTTWAVSTFILAENKIDSYRVQAETAKSETETTKAQVENEKTKTELYKSKVAVLESELSKLDQVNKQYLKWLESEPSSFPALEKKIAYLEEALKQQEVIAETQNCEATCDDKSVESIQSKSYEYSSSFRTGGAFVDPLTKVSLGVTDLNSSNLVTGMLSIPGQKQIELKGIGAGYAYQFTFDQKEYRIVIESAIWVSSEIKVSIHEM
ncbi:hypothetical protein AB7D55_004038 [Vibrio mimicus]